MALVPASRLSPAPSSSQASSIAFPIETNRPTRNRHFTGRKTDLDAISAILQKSAQNSTSGIPSGKGPVCCVIHGIGGIGKTQTALEYTYARSTDYDAIFWIRAETTQELNQSFVDITLKLQLRALYTPTSSQGSISPTNVNMSIEAAIDWLETTDKRWLLVFDNVESTQSIQKFIPRNPKQGGAIILTTQHATFQAITDMFDQVHLKSLDHAESMQLLFECLGHSQADEAEEIQASEIVDIVGGLPLAITTISGYVDKTSTMAEFLDDLKRSNAIWRDTGLNAVQGYERTLGTVFKLGLNNLTPLSRKLLNILAFLNADGIPESMLVCEHDDPELKFLNNRTEYIMMVKDLSSRQLVKKDLLKGGQPQLSLHRSLQLSVLNDLSSNTELRIQTFWQALRLIRQQLPKPSPIQAFEATIYEKYRVFVPQLTSLHRHSLWPEPRITLPIEFARVMIEIGGYMWRNGRYKECEAGVSAAEQMLKDAGLDESDVLYSDIDDALGPTSDFAGAALRSNAFFHRRRSVRIREAMFASIPEDQRTQVDKIRCYNAYADLACTHIMSEEFEAADDLMEICRQQYESWATEEELPGQWAKWYHHSCFAEFVKGNVNEALKRVERGRELQYKQGGRHGIWLFYSFDRAVLLYHSGNRSEALQALAECLASRRELIGDSNPQTLDCYSFIADVLIEHGDEQSLTIARDYLVMCLKPRNRVDWYETNIALAQYRLAKVFAALGDPKAAQPLEDAAKSIRDRYLRDFPQYFKGIEQDAQAVHDQMIGFWSGRMTGRLKHVIRKD